MFGGHGPFLGRPITSLTSVWGRQSPPLIRGRHGALCGSTGGWDNGEVKLSVHSVLGGFLDRDRIEVWTRNHVIQCLIIIDTCRCSTYLAYIPRVAANFVISRHTPSHGHIDV